MNILWIIGQICAVLMAICLFLFLTAKNKRQTKICAIALICLFLIYLTLFFVRMNYIVNQLQNGN